MAYRRSSRRTGSYRRTSRAPARRASYAPRRRSGVRRTARSGGGRGQTIRLVIEGAGPSVARPPIGMKTASGPRKAAFT